MGFRELLHQDEEGLWEVPVLVKEKWVYPDKNSVIIKDFYGRPWGRKPDLTHKQIKELTEYAKDSYSKLNELSDKDLFCCLEEAGKLIKGDSSVDSLASEFNTGTRKWMEWGRVEEVGKSVECSGEYTEFVLKKYRLSKIIPHGPFTAISRETTYGTAAYPVIESVRSKNPVMLSASERGYLAAALVADKLNRVGLRVQMFSFDHRKDGRKMGRILSSSCGLITLGGSKFLYEKAKDMASNNRVGILYQSHGGMAYVGESANIDNGARDIIESAFLFLKSCKKASVVVVHPSVYEEFTGKLLEKVKSLVVGDATNPKSDIPTLEKEYWERVMKPLIEYAKNKGANILHGSIGEVNKPPVIEIEKKKILNFKEKLAEEVRGPILYAIEGGVETTKRVSDMMSVNGKILVISVQAYDRNEINDLRKQGPSVYDWRVNESTNIAFVHGNSDYNGCWPCDHQRQFLAGLLIKGRSYPSSLIS